MSFPVLCLTCGKVLGIEDLVDSAYQKNPEYKKIFKKYNIKRYCCRTIVLTSSNTIRKLMNQNG